MIDALKALANDRRLLLLSWLKDPVAHFPPQTDGDLIKDGVCGVLIAEKLGVSQPSFRHRGVDGAWVYRIHPYPLLGVLNGGSLGEDPNRPF